MDKNLKPIGAPVEKGNGTLISKDFKGTYHSEDTSATYTREELKRMLEIYSLYSKNPLRL